MVRSKVQLDAILGVLQRNACDSGAVDQDIDAVVICKDLRSRRTYGRERREVEGVDAHVN